MYEPDKPCSEKEARDAVETAEGFFEKISGLLKTKNPVQRFNVDFTVN